MHPRILLPMLDICQIPNKTTPLLVTGDGMAGFPCWEPLEKQFSVATELGPDHVGNAADGKMETWSQMMLLQVTSPLLTPPTSFTTTAWTTWPGTGPGWCSSPPWAAQTTLTPAGCRATPGTGPSSSPSTPTTSAWSSSGTWCGRQTPGPSSASQPSSSRWVCVRILFPNLQLQFNVGCVGSCLYVSHQSVSVAVLELHASWSYYAKNCSQIPKKTYF